MEEKENYFSCDYCHRVGTGITIVNGFKMCPMCFAEYQHKSGENNELREELGKKVKEVEQLKKDADLRMKKYNADDLFKVYSDDEEIYSWAEEYLQEIKNSKEYKDYCKYLDEQIEKRIKIKL